MAIVYGVEAKNGLRGTVVDAFGVYSDPALSALLEHVPIRLEHVPRRQTA
jgi:hypothetical protein